MVVGVEAEDGGGGKNVGLSERECGVEESGEEIKSTAADEAAIDAADIGRDTGCELAGGIASDVVGWGVKSVVGEENTEDKEERLCRDE